MTLAERHISNAAEDFDNLNKTLEKGEEMKRAKESEKFALEELEKEKVAFETKDEEDKTLYNCRFNRMPWALREQVRKEILEEMRRDVGARVERITSSEYSGSTSPLSPDEYASLLTDYYCSKIKGGEKKKEGGEEQQDSDNNKSRIGAADDRLRRKPHEQLQSASTSCYRPHRQGYTKEAKNKTEKRRLRTTPKSKPLRISK